MDKEKIRALAEDMQVLLDMGIDILKKHKIASDTIASIAISPDGYMNLNMEDESGDWSLVRCAGEEKARLKMEEVL